MQEPVSQVAAAPDAPSFGADASSAVLERGTAGDVLARARRAPVYDVAARTVLDKAWSLSGRLGRPVLLKREDTQPVHSFKLRGAYARMAAMGAAERARGVLAASAGNHAQGVALAAARLGIRALIVMPETAPSTKVEAVRRFGGDQVEVVLAGVSYSESQARAAELQARSGLLFVHPFDDADVIAGQATVALEILQQCNDLDALFVPVGGGGLLAGCAAVVKALKPGVRVIGVQAADSDAMARSCQAGRRVDLDEVGLFSDGTAVKRVGELSFALCRQYADELLRVDADAVCAAMRDVYAETRTVPEPAGALALAGLKQYAARGMSGAGALAAVVSGANMDFDRLRFVAERAEVGEQREALFAVTIPERRGSFRRFCATLGQRRITEFNYRIGDPCQAQILVGMRINARAEREALSTAFRAEGFAVLDLTEDELARLHLRHMVGGRSALAGNERLFRFEFAERPGALTDFLDHLDPQWNVSLFHYRNHGADLGRIVVGLQVPCGERARLHAFLDALGYTWHDESDHAAYRLLLRS